MDTSVDRARAGLASAKTRHGLTIGAPPAFLDQQEKLPGPELNRMRDGLRLAGLAEG